MERTFVRSSRTSRGEHPDADELKRHARKFLTKFKVPSYIVFMKDLPKSGIGKILKRELRDPIAKLIEGDSER